MLALALASTFLLQGQFVPDGDCVAAMTTFAQEFYGDRAVVDLVTPGGTSCRDGALHYEILVEPAADDDTTRAAFAAWLAERDGRVLNARGDVARFELIRPVVTTEFMTVPTVGDFEVCPVVEPRGGSLAAGRGFLTEHVTALRGKTIDEVARYLVLLDLRAGPRHCFDKEFFAALEGGRWLMVSIEFTAVRPDGRTYKVTPYGLRLTY